MSNFYLAITFYINNNLYLENHKYSCHKKENCSFEEYMNFLDDVFCFDSFQQCFDNFLNYNTKEYSKKLEDEFKDLLLFCFPILSFDDNYKVIDEIIYDIVKPLYNKIIKNPELAVTNGY